VNQPLIRWNGRFDGPPSFALGDLPHVTVVIPHYRQISQLRLTLRALDYQDYPASRLQIVVADDGSPNEAELAQLGDHEFNLHVVRQVHDGFGLARARNAGAAVAEGSRLIFLDADMVPEPDFVSAHVHALADIDYLVSIGDRRHVLPGLNAEELAQSLDIGGTVGSTFQHQAAHEPAWRRDHLRRWKDLEADHAGSYRVASGGNLALHKPFYDDVGGNDGTFRQWGGEDLEFAFRATQWGALFRFNRKAMAWHQGEEAMTGVIERRSQEEQLPLLTNKIASSYLRRSLGPRVYEIPHFIVGIRWCEGLDQTVQVLVDTLLQHPMGVAVRIFGVTDDRGQRILQRAYTSDPRVAVVADVHIPAEVFANSAIPVRSLVLQPGAATGANLLRAVDLLESAEPRPAVVDVRPPNEDAPCAWVWSASAVARARRCASSDSSLWDLLARTSEVMGQICLVTDQTPTAPLRRYESSRELEAIEQRLRKLYWHLSPRTKSALLRLFGIVFRGMK
jgi:GT2 family glycosyltransferase